MTIFSNWYALFYDIYNNILENTEEKWNAYRQKFIIEVISITFLMINNISRLCYQCSTPVPCYFNSTNYTCRKNHVSIKFLRSVIGISICIVASELDLHHLNVISCWCSCTVYYHQSLLTFNLLGIYLVYRNQANLWRKGYRVSEGTLFTID